SVAGSQADAVPEVGFVREPNRKFDCDGK
ncbi:hypothetical protein PF001_g32548, partial [Phytophthora fragariae]